jgi:hypothetical protein
MKYQNTGTVTERFYSQNSTPNADIEYLKYIVF